jgi:hypothetical protein
LYRGQDDSGADLVEPLLNFEYSGGPGVPQVGRVEAPGEGDVESEPHHLADPLHHVALSPVRQRARVL